MKKISGAIIFGIFFIFFSLLSISALNYPQLDADLLQGHNSSFFMPLNKSVVGNFSFNGDCLDGGIELREDGTICGQRLEVFNISSINVTKQTVTVTEDFIIEGNLTIGQKITFAFGEIIDNIVDGWLRITGNLLVDGNTEINGELNVTNKSFFPEFVSIGNPCTPTLQGDGNLCVSGIVASNSSVSTFATQKGLGLVSYSNNADTGGLILFFNGNGIINLPERTFCDTDNPFSENITNFQGAVAISNPPLKTGTPLIFSEFINSTCVSINPINFGLDSTVYTNVYYGISIKPIFATIDNDAILNRIGNIPDAIFQIEIPNGTGGDNVLIDYTAGVGGSHGLDVDANLFGFGGGGAIHSTLISSESIIGGESMNILLTSDLNNFEDGEFNGIEGILTNPGINMENNFIELEGNWTNIIKKGTPEELNKSWYDSTISLTDITSEVKNPAQTTPVFELGNSIVYVGNEINFTSISFSLDVTASNPGIIPLFWYCDGDNNWNLLTGVSDGTDGFRSSGQVAFSNPIDRGACNTQINGTEFSDTENYTYVAIQRTVNNIVTTPEISLISIAGDESPFLLREDLLKLNPVSSPPLTCDANLEGGMYWDDDLGIRCSCNGVQWLQENDWATECT